MQSRFVRFLFILAAVLCGAGSASASEISSVLVEGDGEYTRITLSGDAPISHEAILKSQDGSRSIVLDLPGSEVGIDAETPPPTGAVSSYEIQGETIRFQLARPAMVSRALDIGPTTSDPRHRLVVDLVRVAPVRFDKAARDAEAEAEAASLALVAEAESNEDEIKAPDDAVLQTAAFEPRRHVVVIDPGHGGHDPGALSRKKDQEKDIVLKASLALKKELEASNRYTVYITRSDDTYIEHEDRVSMARNWGADLFISIHADAASSSSVSGATVYTLSSRGEGRIDGTANQNGWELPIEDGTPHEISGILADLIKRETKSNSAIFAELLTPELAKAGPIVRNSHRQANLFVLLAPDVPAVLVEIGFMTNQSDVARLSSEDGRRKTARAIATAIDAYFYKQDLIFAVN